MRISRLMLVITLYLFSSLSCGAGSSPVGAPQGSDEVYPEADRTPTRTPSLQPPSPAATLTPTPAPALSSPVTGQPRGYLTTPQELAVIKQKADQGIEPYQSAVDDVLDLAQREWDYALDTEEGCAHSDDPRWNDDTGGTRHLYAKALAYHLTGDSRYAEEVKDVLERIMTTVRTISVEDKQCRLNFGWGTPELVASADLLEEYWRTDTCTGPTGTRYENRAIGTGSCKELFQNWLVKNPYYVVSYGAVSAQSNWGAAATNAIAYIADYVWDRPEVTLIHRNPEQVNNGRDVGLKPAEAYARANQLLFDRINGYGVEYDSSSSCDYLSGSQQNRRWPAVKSQITENGIIPEDARREEYCNIPEYNGEYQNYPQIHLGNTIQQCELMLRRGDRSCFDNVDNSDIPHYTFLGPEGRTKTTHLYPGRGSVERAIKAIIVDSDTQWRHDPALAVAYRYYYNYHTLPGIEQWAEEIGGSGDCDQDVCLGILTHGFAPDETPGLPPVVAPPGGASHTPTPGPTSTPTGEPTETPTLPPTGQVSATVETDPVPNNGDAADDPAIWIHPTDPSQSLIIGTDKKGGLAAYDLAGHQVQYLDDGKMNNVDIRYNFPLGGEHVALVTAGNRTNDSIAIYQVNPAMRRLENVAARTIEVAVDETYGSCMYHSPVTGKYYFIVNDKDGAVEQWEIFDNGAGLVDARNVRAFDVGSQTEGCVADDEHGYLYIGEEATGIWKYGAEPEDGTTRTQVDSTDSGGHLTADVEGLTLYYASDGAGYLIASSQGSDEYVVYRREGDNDYVTTFGIVEGNGIDGVSHTDGIDVTNFPLGSAFPQGVFVAQDDANDDGNQNYKLVPWGAIANAVSPPLVIDTAWDPRQIGAGGMPTATPTSVSTSTPAPTSTPANSGNTGNRWYLPLVSGS